jgi:geranylgeranyl diphosphate synthase type I
VHLAAGAAGGDPALVGPAALAVEVFHTWTLIHDDLIDNDAMRRGGPSVHVAARDRQLVRAPRRPFAESYGRAVAILAGDYLQGVAPRLVLECAAPGVVSVETARAAAHLLHTDLVRDLVDGEILDVALALRPVLDVSEDELVRMYRWKSAALLGYALRVGAMLALDTPDGRQGLPAALAAFGEACGVAFQIQDDILGVTGDETRLGKPVGSDIREGKRTLVLRRAYEAAGVEERAFLDRVVGDGEAAAEEVARVVAILRGRGGLDRARDEARRRVEEARALLGGVPPSVHRDLLAELAGRLVDRDR